MIKRFILYSLCILLVGVGVYHVWNNYKPQKADIVDIETITYKFPNNYQLADFENLMRNTEDTMFVIFYSHEDLNSQYFFNTTWPNLLHANPLIKADNIFYVDVANREGATIALVNYGFYTLPALVSLNYRDEKIIINNSLQDSAGVSFADEAITSWLTNNNLIEQPPTEEEKK